MEWINDHTALLIVDVQNDFIPGGALAVTGGDRVVPIINELQKKFRHVIATQDFHPANHGSFASNHPEASRRIHRIGRFDTDSLAGSLCSE